MTSFLIALFILLISHLTVDDNMSDTVKIGAWVVFGVIILLYVVFGIIW